MKMELIIDLGSGRQTVCGDMVKIEKFSDPTVAPRSMGFAGEESSFSPALFVENAGRRFMRENFEQYNGVLLGSWSGGFQAINFVKFTVVK